MWNSSNTTMLNVPDYEIIVTNIYSFARVVHTDELGCLGIPLSERDTR
jgi:hypothetical protein